VAALDRLRARTVVAGMIPIVVLAPLAWFGGNRALSPLPPASLAPLGLCLPLSVAAALVQVGPFGIGRRTRKGLSFALTLTLFVGLYALAAFTIELFGAAISARLLNVIFLF